MRKLSIVFLTGLLAASLGGNAFAASSAKPEAAHDAKKEMLKPAAKLHKKHQTTEHKKLDEKK